MSHPTGGPIVVIRDLVKRFGEVEVLKNLSMDIARSEAVCIIGPSGSGKSTLLRCINGLVPISSGSIKVEGREVNDPKLDVLALRRNVGMVFQQYNLFPHKTALDNIMMAPLIVLGQDRAEVEERARRLLAKVRLTGKENAYPGELSGGQQQRVAIARALANNPPLLLADEPTGNLDSESGVLVLEALREIRANAGTTVVIVTHDRALAEKTDRVMTLVDGQIVH